MKLFVIFALETKQTTKFAVFDYKIFFVMFDLKLKFNEFTLVASSILTRIDFVRQILSSSDLDVVVRQHYASELSSLLALYDKITSRE